MTVIETNNLTKEYPSKSFSKHKILALSKFSFNVESGEIFGLLGPNGAGKTTLFKLLLGIAFPTEGEAKIFDRNINDIKIKTKIGYLPENHRFQGYFTAEQILIYYGNLSGMKNPELSKRINELLKLVKLEEWKKTKVRKFSKGMFQRLGIAQAIINHPDLVFLDEPTDGVDPIGRKEIRDIMLDLKSKGKTVFLNSHLLSEVELVCDRVAILNKGVLIKEGLVNEIISETEGFVMLTSDLNDDLVNYLLLNYKVSLHGKNNFKFNSNDVAELNNLIDYLRKNGILIHNISKEKNTLENMFINLINKQN
jgi:ABC-2 type transport system ATP-binding protein